MSTRRNNNPKGRVSTRKQLEIAENKRQAIALRNAGANYREIAQQMSVSISTVHGWVQSEIARIPAEEAAMLRRTEVERMDRLQRAIWQKALDGDLEAVRTALSIIDRRARMLGLDAPAQLDVGVGHVDISHTAQRILRELSDDTIDAEVIDDETGAEGDDG